MNIFKKIIKGYVMSIFLFLSLANTLEAQTYTTIADGSWITAGIWDLGSSPSYTSNWSPATERNAVIQNNLTLGTGSESIDINGYWNTISITNGSTLIINVNTLKLEDHWPTGTTNINVIDGTLIINGDLTLKDNATLNVQSNGSVVVNGNISAVGNGGYINVAAGGDLDINGTLALSNGNSTINNAGYVEANDLEVSGGNTHFNSTGTVNIINDVTLSGSGALLVDAGIMSVGGDFVNSAWPSGAAVTINGYLDVAGNFQNDSQITGTGGIGWGGSWIAGGGSTVEKAPYASAPPYNPYSLATGGPYASVLPVKLISFTAKINSTGIQLDWATAQEENFDYFTVQRSIDGLNFISIGTIQGHGNSSVRNDYTFNDSDPAFGIGYYRLKATDYDGSVEYFKMVAANYAPELNNISIYPNPGNGQYINIKINSQWDGNTELLIFDLSGQVLVQKNVEGYADKIEFNNKLNRGYYIAQIRSGNTIYKQKISVN